MKKIITAALLCAIILSLCGCNKDSSAHTGGTSSVVSSVDLPSGSPSSAPDEAQNPGSVSHPDEESLPEG
jgi:hypothetical protein